MQKYEITNLTRESRYGGIALHQIRALQDIPKFGVKVGDYGGYVENENNLSQDGDCWIAFGAEVFGHAHVYENALIKSGAIVEQNSRIHGDAIINGNSLVCGNSNIYGSSIVSGDVFGKEINGVYPNPEEDAGDGSTTFALLLIGYVFFLVCVAGLRT